mmetsp:Transcript_53732/g.143766  ORF Transcript_53732/g.143766 Transcript_53732/m.143766 type:complete len:240 (+) Transcript_53732:89-808(+)
MEKTGSQRTKATKSEHCDENLENGGHQKLLGEHMLLGELSASPGTSLQHDAHDGTGARCSVLRFRGGCRVQVHGPVCKTGDRGHLKPLPCHRRREGLGLRELQNRPLKILVLVSTRASSCQVPDEWDDVRDEELCHTREELVTCWQGELQDANAAGGVRTHHPLHFTKGEGAIGHVSDSERHRDLVNGVICQAGERGGERALRTDAADAGEILCIAIAKIYDAVQASFLDLHNPSSEHL